MMRCEHSKCPSDTYKSCLPTEKQMKKISVSFILFWTISDNSENYANSCFKGVGLFLNLDANRVKTSCFTVEVEEHTKCICDCPKITCHPPQVIYLQ